MTTGYLSNGQDDRAVSENSRFGVRPQARSRVVRRVPGARVLPIHQDVRCHSMLPQAIWSATIRHFLPPAPATVVFHPPRGRSTVSARGPCGDHSDRPQHWSDPYNRQSRSLFRSWGPPTGHSGNRLTSDDAVPVVVPSSGHPPGEEPGGARNASRYGDADMGGDVTPHGSVPSHGHRAGRSTALEGHEPDADLPEERRGPSPSR